MFAGWLVVVVVQSGERGESKTLVHQDPVRVDGSDVLFCVLRCEVTAAQFLFLLSVGV